MTDAIVDTDVVSLVFKCDAHAGAHMHHSRKTTPSRLSFMLAAELFELTAMRY